MVVRLQWHRQMGRMRARGVLAYRTLIVGTNEEAVHLAEKLAPRPHLGFAPIGFLRTDRGWREAEGLPILGGIDDLAHVLRESRIECVFIASTALAPEDMKRISRAFRQHEIEVRISANLAYILAPRL